MITFYRNTRTRVIKSVADERITVKGITLDGVQDHENPKHWDYYSDTTGVVVCTGTRSHCIRWINDNAESIKKLLDQPAYREYAIDIAYAREAYGND